VKLPLPVPVIHYYSGTDLNAALTSTNMDSLPQLRTAVAGFPAGRELGECLRWLAEAQQRERAAAAAAAAQHAQRERQELRVAEAEAEQQQLLRLLDFHSPFH
jgi:hypothetical protein